MTDKDACACKSITKDDFVRNGPLAKWDLLAWDMGEHFEVPAEIVRSQLSAMMRAGEGFLYAQIFVAVMLEEMPEKVWALRFDERDQTILWRRHQTTPDALYLAIKTLKGHG